MHAAKPESAFDTQTKGLSYSIAAMRSVMLELTLVAVCATFVYILSHTLDLLELVVGFAQRYETWEIDEIITVGLFLMFAGGLFAFRRLRESRAAQAVIERRNRDLEDALARIRTLEGILPICCYCKKILNEGADRSMPKSWVPVETYVRNHTDAEFSHGICPECMTKHHADD